MAFISNNGLENLKKYKYVSGGYSYLDNKINPFWVFISELYPNVSIYQSLIVACSKYDYIYWIYNYDLSLFISSFC